MGVQIPLPPLLYIASEVIFLRNQGISCTRDFWHRILVSTQHLESHGVETSLAIVRLCGLHASMSKGERGSLDVCIVIYAKRLK